MKLNFGKMGGLVPVIVQDSSTMQVLMLGFMNKEAYEKTLSEGKVIFWSRTKGRLWQKGETSGNYLEVVNIKADCDSDTLLVLARPNGPVCHKGTFSCFGDNIDGVDATSFLDKLFELIKTRRREMPKNSYTTSLFEDGLSKICKKIGEEAVEVVLAASVESRQRLIEESGDLLYHLLVLLAEKEVEFSDVIEELLERHRK